MTPSQRVSGPSRGRQVSILNLTVTVCNLCLSFRPLSRQIGSYTEKLRILLSILSMDSFRPLARQIGSYTCLSWQTLKIRLLCFRPLARQIGIYTRFYLKFGTTEHCFRPLSRQIGIYTVCLLMVYNMPVLVSGPSRGRQVSILGFYITLSELNLFPSPLEVNRELYIWSLCRL